MYQPATGCCGFSNLWKLLNCDRVFTVLQTEERIMLNLCSFCGFSHVKGALRKEMSS